MRRTARDFRRRTTQAALELANLARRVIFASTSGGQWAIRGYETPDGVEGDDDEPADVFPGVGIYARPAGDAEGVLVNVGAKADHPTIVATRDEDARRAYVEEFGDIAAGEIVVFNGAGKSRVIIRADGAIQLEAESGSEILVRSPGGTTDQLVTKTDFENHVHSHAATGTPTAPEPLPPATGFSYTTVLKAE